MIMTVIRPSLIVLAWFGLWYFVAIKLVSANHRRGEHCSSAGKEKTK